MDKTKVKFRVKKYDIKTGRLIEDNIRVGLPFPIILKDVRLVIDIVK